MSDTTKLKKGDTVRLKSGGPVMTLGGTPRGSELNICHWFIGEEHKSAKFPSEILVKADPEDDAQADFTTQL